MSSSSRPAEILSIALGCLSLTSPILADAPATRPAFSVIDETWRDAARNRDVPVRLYLPADASKPSPTIVVSHGLGDTRLAMGYACEVWAAHGFVVATLQHIGSDDSVWKNVAPADRFGSILRAASPQQFLLRCGDVKFALDELSRRTADDGPVGGRVDTTRFALAGHSFGALTVQALIGQRYQAEQVGGAILKDNRVKAAVIMSPGMEGVVDPATAFGDITVPVFYFTGTVDVVTGLGLTPASKRRVPFDRSVGSDRYLLTFNRGDHMVFSGHRPAGIDDARYDRIQAEVARWSTAFFEATLQGNSAAREQLAHGPTDTTAGDRFEHLAPATQPAR